MECFVFFTINYIINQRNEQIIQLKNPIDRLLTINNTIINKINTIINK